MNSGNIDITPIQTLAGQRILKLSLTDYNSCNIGDSLKLKEVLATDNKYQTYLSFKEARYLITSKFVDGTDYYITINDYYPMPQATEYTFVKYNRTDTILLNELYFRANPVMEAEVSYDFVNNQSIEEFGKRDYALEGKSILKDDFLKITAYLKDTYNGITANGIRNKIRSELMRRVDLEAGDVVYISDSVYTQYNNQKVLITKKDVKVDSNGVRDENYEMITMGDYEIQPETLNSYNIISWIPDVTPTYSHDGNEGDTDQDTMRQIDNKRMVLQDLVEGQIYVDEIAQSVFYATTDLPSTITKDIEIFELGLKAVAGTVEPALSYRNSLLGLNTEGIVKINSEYISYKSLGYNAGANTATLQVIKRGIGGSSRTELTSNIRVQFYKIITKISSKGLKSTDLSLGDGTNNFIEVHTETGVEIQSTKVVKISNPNNTLYFSDNNNGVDSYLYMNNNAIKLGADAISAGKDGFLITKDSNNYLSYNTTDNIFEIKTQSGYIGSSSNYFDISNSKINIGTGGKLRIGSTDNTSTTLMQVGETTGNYIKFDTSTGVSIKGNLDVVGGSINLTTTDTYNSICFDSTHSTIKMNINDTSANWGLQIGKNISSSNYFNFDSTGFVIKSNNINLYKDANNFLTLNNATSAISLYQSATNKFTFDLVNGVDIITSKGKIGGVSDNYFDITNGKIYLNAGKQQIGTGLTDSSGTFNGMFIGNTTLSNNTYLKYDGTDLTIKTSKGFIGSSTTNFDITNKSLTLGTDGSITIGSGVNLFTWDNANGLVFKTTKDVIMSNTNNNITFDSATNTGKIQLNYNGTYYRQQIGSGLADSSGVSYDGLFVGNPTLTSNTYIKYDGTDLTIKTSKGNIGSANNYFDITNEKISLVSGAIVLGKNAISGTTDGIFIGTNGKLRINSTDTTATTLMFVGSGTNYLKYDTSTGVDIKGKVSITSGDIKINTSTDNNHLEMTSSLGRLYLGQTTGTVDFKMGTGNKLITYNGTDLVIKSANVEINTSSDNNYISLIPTASKLYLGKNGTNIDVQIGSASGSHINYLNGVMDIKTTKINIVDTGTDSLISLNSGKQQIGNGIVTYIGATPQTTFNGLFVGDTNLTNEKYIKYDGSNFRFGDNVQIAGIMKTGDQIRVVDVSADTVVKYGEIASGIFGFDYTSPTNPTTEYFRLADATGGGYTQGMTLKTAGTIDISNTNNLFYFENGTNNNSYIRMNTNQQQIGRISNLTGKADFNGFYFGNTDLSQNKYMYYDGNLVIAGNVSIGGSSASTVVSNANNGNTAWAKFSGTGNTLPSGNVEFNFATSSSKGGNAIDTDNVNGVASSTVLSNISQALSDASTAQSTADGKIMSFYQDSPPTVGISEGDIWFDTNDGNKIYIYEGASWVNRQDSKIAQAISDASTAQSTADIKITTFFSNTQPVAISMGDLWYNTVNYEIKRWDGVIWSLVADITSEKTSKNTDNVGTQSALTVQSATVNFNGRNDRLATAIVLPTIATDGTSVDHTINTDSTSNISFEWLWSGSEADIDGFIVYIYQSMSATGYTFGTTPSSEQVYYVTPEKRAFILYGTPADSYYTFGVQSYRIVDKDINANSVIKTSIVKPSIVSENPYRPSASVSFGGNITGTISGTSASTVVSNANNGNTAFNGTGVIRDTTNAPSNSPAFGAITTGTASPDGNIVITIPYTYTQGTIKADYFIVFYREGGGGIASTDVAFQTGVSTTSMKLILKPNTAYRFGIQAVRKTNNGILGTSIIASSDITTANNYISTTNVNNKIALNTALIIGKDAISAGKDGIYAGDANTFLSINTTDKVINMKTTGTIDISNDKNSLYFATGNNDNSYLRMNNNTIKLGKDAITSGNNGFSLYKDVNNYLTYSTTNGSFDFKGQYFNNTAYCYSDIDFIGACASNIQLIKKYTITGSLDAGTLNPYYGKTIYNIIIMSPIDITSIDQSHFLSAFHPYGAVGNLKFNFNITTVASYGNSPLIMDVTGGETISKKNWGMAITYYEFPAESFLQFIGLVISTSKKIWNASSARVEFVSCAISIYNNGGFDGGNSGRFAVLNSYIGIYTIPISVFKNIKQIDNLYFNIQSTGDLNLTSNTNTVLESCSNIKNIEFLISQSNLIRIFFMCENIQGIKMNNNTAILFESCKNISKVSAIYSPILNYPFIGGVEYMSDVRVNTTSGNYPVISNSIYIQNCNFPNIKKINRTSITKDKNNSWNDIMLTKGNNITAGSFVVGEKYTILSVGTTNFTLIGASSNTVGVTFIATGVGSGTGVVSYTLSRDDIILNSNHTTPVTYTLPLVNENHETRIYTIKDISSAGAYTNNITVQRQGTDLIDGATSFTINSSKGSVAFYSDGAQWRRLIYPTTFGY